MDAGSGSCVLREPRVSQIAIDAITFFHGKRFELNAAVVMPNHCHVLVRPLEDHELEDILESWKGFTARKINRLLDRVGVLWQEDSFDRIVRDEDHYRKIVRYVRANPHKASLREGEFRLWEGGSNGLGTPFSDRSLRC